MVWRPGVVGLHMRLRLSCLPGTVLGLAVVVVVMVAMALVVPVAVITTRGADAVAAAAANTNGAQRLQYLGGAAAS